MKVALVVGATGLIGKSVIYQLLKNDHYHKIIVLTRRDLVLKHQKLEQHIINFNDLEKHKNLLIADDIFCCLGTTNAQTPDENIYKKIDVEYPLTIAKIAFQNGARQYLLVSAMGANINSTLFYNKLKGEVEEKISLLNYPTLHLIRPALLLGSRKTLRVGEKIAQMVFTIINPLFFGPLKKYKAIPGETVAKAMVNLANKNLTGKNIWQNNQLFDQAK